MEMICNHGGILHPHSIKTKSSAVCKPPCPLPNLCHSVEWKDKSFDESKARPCPHKMLDLWITGDSELLVDKGTRDSHQIQKGINIFSIKVSYLTSICIKEAQLEA